MPKDTRKSRSRAVSMFDLVPREATEGTVRATKLCLSAAGGRVTFTLPLTVATWQPTTGCRTFFIGSSPVNKPGVPDNWEVGLRVTVKQPGLCPLCCYLVLLCGGSYCLFRSIAIQFGVSCTAGVLEHLSTDMPGSLRDDLGCTLEHSPQEGHNFHSVLYKRHEV